MKDSTKEKIGNIVGNFLSKHIVDIFFLLMIFIFIYIGIEILVDAKIISVNPFSFLDKGLFG